MVRESVSRRTQCRERSIARREAIGERDEQERAVDLDIAWREMSVGERAVVRKRNASGLGQKKDFILKFFLNQKKYN